MSPVAPSGTREPLPLLAPAQRHLSRWVGFWDEREPPTTLALIRILLASVVLVDLLTVGAYRLSTWLWAPVEAGGISPLDASNLPPFYRAFPVAGSSAVLLWVGLTVSMFCFGIGWLTRSAALAFVCLSAQAALINLSADRAIDRAIRIMLLIFVFSSAGKVWSVDAKFETGSFRGARGTAPAWPRYLILGQLVLIYWGAGLAKGGTSWYPWGGYRALYLILQDPILAAGDFRWLSGAIPYFSTQLATASTHLWELSAPLVLLAAHYRRTRARPGRLRRLFNRLPIRNAYVALGVLFHLTLAATMRLGIFPFAMLACFPAFFRPEELERAFERALNPRWAARSFAWRRLRANDSAATARPPGDEGSP